MASIVSNVLILLNLLITSQAIAFDKVVIIPLENTDYSKAMREPFFQRLCKEGACATDFHAEAHPSQPNYVSMIGGSTLGVTGNGSVNLNYTSLPDLIEAKGLTWGLYAQNYPGNCWTGGSSNGYVRKHAPAISFIPIQKNPMRCARIQPATEFKWDQLPNWSMYVPNMDNSGHDTSVSFAARWLELFMTPLMSKPELLDQTVVVVTFDEDGGSRNNKIFTSFYGGPIKPGAVATARLDHYSLLKMIEDEWALGNLGRNDVTATPVQGIWK